MRFAIADSFSWRCCRLSSCTRRSRKRRGFRPSRSSSSASASASSFLRRCAVCSTGTIRSELSALADNARTSTRSWVGRETARRGLSARSLSLAHARRKIPAQSVSFTRACCTSSVSHGASLSMCSAPIVHLSGVTVSVCARLFETCCIRSEPLGNEILLLQPLRPREKLLCRSGQMRTPCFRCWYSSSEIRQAASHPSERAASSLSPRACCVRLMRLTSCAPLPSAAAARAVARGARRRLPGERRVRCASGCTGVPRTHARSQYISYCLQ
eukprot:4617189-Pleurochrysis_carterae.AAC.2